MSINNKIGIWMDHSKANLFAVKNNVEFISTIKNDFDHTQMQAALDKGESLMQNKRQQHQEEFYTALKTQIINYNEVLLFGPTNAKTELLNLLLADLKFMNIIIKIEPADKMTDPQKEAFVKDYFSGM